MLGVSYFLAGGEGSRFSHGVKSWHWSPTACEGMLSSECWFYLSFGHQFICSTIFSLNRNGHLDPTGSGGREMSPLPLCKTTGCKPTALQSPWHADTSGKRLSGRQEGGQRSWRLSWGLRELESDLRHQRKQRNLREHSEKDVVML